MAFLRNTKAPAGAPGGLAWDDEDSVVEVEPDLATELLRIPDGGFVEVTDTGKPLPTGEQTPSKKAAAKPAAKTPIEESSVADPAE